MRSLYNRSAQVRCRTTPGWIARSFRLPLRTLVALSVATLAAACANPGYTNAPPPSAGTIAALAMSLSSASVIGNALRLRGATIDAS